MLSRRLAARAPDRDPLLERRTQLAAHDDLPAAAAPLAGPAVDPEPGASGGVAGRYRRTAGLVRVEQPPGQVNQLWQFGHLADQAPGVDAAQEQGFRPVDGADPGQVPLVK